ncbi:MAG TPA: hypothetical protein VIS07_22655 [Candidatus Binatia bacterium]
MIMRWRKLYTLAFASSLALAAIFGGALARTASADIGDTDPLFQCTEGSSADLGDVKLSPGLTTKNGKVTLSSQLASLGACAADEDDLDEIATSSKFGVKKTAAGGRLPVTGATAKLKLTFYGDCLGIGLPNDPSATGEYPRIYGTVDVQWMSGATKITGLKSTIFGTLELDGLTATLSGIVTKGAGVGGTATLTAQLELKADGSDDANRNGLPDFLDCAIVADDTAKSKALDLLGPLLLEITL